MVKQTNIGNGSHLSPARSKTQVSSAAADASGNNISPDPVTCEHPQLTALARLLARQAASEFHEHTPKQAAIADACNGVGTADPSAMEAEVEHDA